MKAIITIDTVYLSVRYPKVDVFNKWYQYAKDVDHQQLKNGIVVGEFVVRTGSSGYKVSVWQHDARVFLTDEVDEKRGEGQGMGIWVQLGPKFLLENINHLEKAVTELLAAVGVKGEYPCKITRLDVTVDLLGMDIEDQDITQWRMNWVGRSKLSKVIFNSRTGKLETLYVGSGDSPIYLRVYNKVAEAEHDKDLVYWRDVWKDVDSPVTRIEWEIKPNDGNFSDDLKQLSLLNGFSIRELLNYLLDWGRLCTPDPNDSNRRRWKDAPFWAELRKLVAEWAEGVDWPTSRYGKEFHGITDGYIKHLSGTIAGGMARFKLDQPSIVALLEGLAENGETLEVLNRKAARKARLFKNL